MGKPGKANTFLGGMKMDMDPILQPKESYRYAKNIRLASYVGKNIAAQPYDSDKLALVLGGGDVVNVTLSSISDIINWTSVSETIATNSAQLTWQSFFTYLSEASLGIDVESFFTLGTLSANYDYEEQTSDGYDYFFELIDWYESNTGAVNVEWEYDDWIMPAFEEGGFWISFYDYFLDNYPNLPLTVVASGVEDSNSDGVGLTFTVTLVMSAGDNIVVDVNVPPFAEISDAVNNPLYFEEIIANQITTADNGVTATVSLATGNNVYWSFMSSIEEIVSSITIDVNGTIAVTPNMDDFALSNQWLNIYDSWYISSGYDLNPSGSGGPGNFLGYVRDFQTEFATYFQYEVNNYLSGIDGVSDTFDIEQNLITAGETTYSSDISIEEIGNIYISPGMQILGHYAFSDYLVILGTWIENEDITGYPSDFVLKTSQKKDGTLVNVGEEGIYELFFVGNLGFSNKKKLKVAGAEENEHVRRIYFTDGDIPLRTMNVGADSSIYSQYTDDPGYFDLFIETKISVPKVTGFTDGGQLESIGHAYAFRYKTLDGRMSRISPVCNPASLPLSASTSPSAFTKGGNPGENTSKSIKGVIENIDSRYPFIEMIHIPYIGGAPGVAQVFGTYPTPAGSDTLNWIHTGYEIVREEIIALEFGSDYISWDSCKALEVKDNRLFVGNLKGVAESVDTDFTVVSYTGWNKHHSYETGNPDLFNDLLYSWAGVSYNSDGEDPDYHGPQQEEYGKYTKPNGVDLYRYIKGPEDGEGENNGLYTSSLSAPEYWTAENTSPSSYGVKRGIFGAESKHFRTPLGNGQFEGVRVTFRVLGGNDSDTPPVQLDNTDKLITTGSVTGAKPPFYTVDKNQDSGGYYASYANPMYNSNYVGYRRGEIYRFGLLFYDKKGSPMFVKRIGDIRMPEHSSECLVPTYASSTVTGFNMKWPYYYQTSRSNLDGGFVDWPNPTWDDDKYIKPYSQHNKGEGQYGCVLHPYFEVKLSSGTCKKISGYTIVRVERTPENKTISTSGILQRAVKYSDDDPDSVWNDESQNTLGQSTESLQDSGGDNNWLGSNRCGMAGKFGNYHNSIFTPTIQDYRSHIYGMSASDYSNSTNDSKQFYTVGRFQNHFGADTPLIGGDKHWSHSNIFTMDSPDAIINSNFNLNFGSGDRIKITESRYCIKQPIKNGGQEGNHFRHFFNSYLSDGFYGGYSGQSRPDMELPSQAVSLFACQIDAELLDGEDIEYYQPETTTSSAGLTVMNFGGWKHRLSDKDKWSTDWKCDLFTFDLLWRRTEGYFQGNYGATSGPTLGDEFLDNEEPKIGDWDTYVNLGVYTKYYSKRIGAYPMYGMARPDWNKFKYGDVGDPREHWTTGSTNGDAGGHGFGMNTRDWKNNHDDKYIYPCFTAGAAWKKLSGVGWQGEATNAIGNLNGNPDSNLQISPYLSLSGDEHYLEYIDGAYTWDFKGKYEDWGGARATNVVPDILANAGLEGSTNDYGEKIDSYITSSSSLDPYWRESNIHYAQVVSPGQEITSSVLGSDRPYRNASMWHDPHAQNRIFSLNSTSKNGRNFSIGGNIGSMSNVWDEGQGGFSESRADFALGHKTIVMSLPHHAMLPITRHCLQANNWRERVYFQFGGPNKLGFFTSDALGMPADFETTAARTKWTCGADPEEYNTFNASNLDNEGASGSSHYGRTGGGSKWSVDSPEVTMASIVKNHNANTLYGGNTSTAFSKNTFVSTGSFRQVNQITQYNGDGNNGLPVFGGDTFIANFSLKKVHNPDTDDEYSDRGVLTAYTCPVETETNLDLRHGYFFGGDTQNIAKQIPDDVGNYAYNPSYDAENKIQVFSPKPFGFVEIDHWPSTVAFSEPKMTGDVVDNYSIFPINQVKDLDYSKGPITQMFNLQNRLFALQDSGTCQLAVNPRVMIPAGEGGAIQAVTGTDNVIERYDYLSESLGSQNFHGLAVSDNAAYFYDDNASKFLKLGPGKGGGFGVSSLGDSLGMQTFFQQYHNQTIGDIPLFSPNLGAALPSASGGEYVSDLSSADTFTDLNWGGVNIGYDPEFGEVLLTIYNKNAYTLVYNENLNVFTSFISKRPSNYINFQNRLYCTYDFIVEGGDYPSNTALYLSNGYIYDEEADDNVARYLNFGGTDYYILGHGNSESYSYDLETESYITYDSSDDMKYPTEERELEKWGVKSSLLSKEPIQIHFVLNDEPSQPKVFDNIDVYMKAHTVTGAATLYFRKFTFLGSANLGTTTEYDASEFTNVEQNYSVLPDDTFLDNISSGERTWYSVKDGTHHIPLRRMGVGIPAENTAGNLNAPTIDSTVRGTYAIVAASIGWDEGSQWFGNDFPELLSSEFLVIKNEGFSILSITPYYRYSRR